MKTILCHVCGTIIEKDIVALNKKILGRQIKRLLCLTCFSDYLSCPEEDLLLKIEEFKEQGCGLFR